MPCYHALSADWPADLSITPESFAAQLEWLVERGYRGVTFREAVTAPAGEKLVAATFDDAYRSVIELGLPIMRRLGIPGTVFVPSAWPDREEPMQWPGIDHWLGGPHGRELACMSWAELRSLADEGWEIGSHTHTHPRLPQLADADLTAELRRSRELCEEHLERPCPSIAYPYGAYDERVAAAAGEAGYSYGATLKASIRSPRPLVWPRIGIYHGDRPWRWRLKLSPLVGRARASRLGDAVDRARGV